MSTTIVTRASKGGRLSFTDMDNNLLNLQTTADAAAPKATTLSGYGITDAYTKTQIDTSLGLKANSSSLATVATSGSYIDLLNKPTIPTVISALTNDSGYQTAANVSSAIQAVVGAAPAALDTLQEIAAQLATDESAVSALTTTVSGKVTSNLAITAGTGTKVTYDAKGLITGSTTLSATDIPSLDWTKITTGKPTTLSGYGITDAQGLNADLTSIIGLVGTSGFLKKTAANTWSLDTSTYLTNNQSITISGDATGSGTTSIALTLANSGVTVGTYKSVTVDAKGRVTAGTNPTTLSGYGIIDAQGLNTNLTSVAGLSAISTGLVKLTNGVASLDTSSYLTANQSISVTGDVTGSGTTSIALTLANSGVTAGTYKSVTVDAKGRITAGTNPTTLSGYGITDAINSSLIGAVSGIAPLGSDSKIAATYLPSYVDDVLEYTNLAAFPITGETGKIYTALDTNKIYRWSGTVYIEISASPGSTDAVTEGVTNLYFTNARAQAAVTSVSGNAGTATKLATTRSISMTGDATWSIASFDGSTNVTAAATLATITDSGVGSFKKITVDTKGRVTGTTAVAQADITGLLGAGSITNTMLANSAVANLSGTNTGDETATTIKTKLGITTLSGSNTGDQTITLTGDVTGTGTGSFAATLANSGVTAGTYGSATQIVPITVDAKGRITTTGVATTITPAWSSITSIPTTVSGYGITDAYTKTQVDSLVQGLDPKASVVAATTANITLSAPQTIDGIAVVVGDRVLVKNQTTTSQNGIYVVATLGWTRATDMDAWTEVPGAYVFVEKGTTLADTGWVCTSDQGGTLDTTAIIWSQFAGAGSVTGGTGISITGTQVSLTSGVATAGTYKSVTVDTYGRVTAGTNPTTLAGYGITDAQGLNANLTSVAGLSAISTGLVKLTNGVASLDTSSYLTANQSISVTGDATGSGTTSIALTLANSGVTTGTYKSVTVDAKGRVTAGTNPTTLSGYGITDAVSNTTSQIAAYVFAAPSTVAGAPTFRALVATDIPTLNQNTTGSAGSVAWSGVASKPTTLSGYGITDAQGLNANLTSVAGLSTITTGLVKLTNGVASLDTSSYLTANQSISVTGDATGTGTTSVVLTLANSGVTAGTYKSVTVDAKGRVTAGTNPTTLSGYGITDAMALVAPGISGNILTSNGTSWVSQASSGGSGATLSDDTSTNTTQYLGMSRATSGAWTTAYTASSKLYFNPSTGTLNSTNFNSLSDKTKKTDIVEITDAIKTVSSIEGVEFNWLENGQKSSGVIAQQLETILPHLVETTEDGLKSVNYSGIIGYLISAVKELSKEIEILKSV